MLLNGKILGKPLIEYTGTQSQIESLTNPKAGMVAFATDLGKLGYYNGSSWIWSTTSAGSTGDIQYNNGGILAADTGNLSYDPVGNPLGATGVIFAHGIISPSVDASYPYVVFGGGLKNNYDGNDTYVLGGDSNGIGTTGGNVIIQTGFAAGGGSSHPGKVKMISNTLTMTNFLIFDTSNITSVDRTATFPDRSGTIAYLGDVVHAHSITYISGTGTAGTDNTAMTVKTITLPANTLTQIGDRIRIQCHFASTGASAAVGSTKLNTVLTANTSVSSTSLSMTDCWLHYIDNTHANIIENEAGALGAVSNVNVSGFTWNANQDIIFTQDAVSGQHLIVYSIIVDIYPKGN